MNALLKSLEKPQLLDIASDLIEHVMSEVDGCKQKDMAETAALSTPAISSMHTKKQCTCSERVIRNAILKIKEHYQVAYDEDSGKFSGGEHPDGKTKKELSNFFTSARGNRWKIIVHIKYWESDDQDIGIRYLNVHNMKKVDFHVGSKQHADYEGSARFDPSGRHLIVDLFTKIHGSKEVNLRFLVGNRAAEPELLEGFMMHSCIDDNSMVTYTVLAQNISGSGELVTPQIIPFDSFKEQQPIIAEFFEFRNTAIHVHSDVYSLDRLQEVNLKRRKELIEKKKRKEMGEGKATL